MIEKYRTWINLWHDEAGNHCVITKVIVRNGVRHERDIFFRPSLASAIRLSNVVSKCVLRGEGELYPNVVGIGWSWQKEGK